MAYVLKAMPGRFLGRFERPKEKQGLIIVPEKWQQRPEFAEVIDVGEPLAGKPEQEQFHEKLCMCMELGIKVPVSYGSGTTYWHGLENALEKDEWGWLADIRVFNLSDPASMLFTDEQLAEIDALRWQTADNNEEPATAPV